MMRLPEIEEKILKFWEKNKIFEKSKTRQKGRPYFTFYDGPPFATGKPHYGHILATTIKDTVLRYWTMKGYQVPRRVGWDCHGLPVENLIEKELGIKNKKEIEAYGIGKFNKACRASVFRCVKDFEQTLKRAGRWADYKTAYATLESEYIESVWWVFKQLWQKGLVYQDYRVAPYCPRCATPLSNFEVNQGYKDTKDPSVFIKFKIQDTKYKIQDTYFLVWTTTPWTLPGNVALAIDPKARYILAEQNNEHYILAEKRERVLRGRYRVVQKISGKDLVNLKCEPLFDYLLQEKVKNIENAFKVVPADFVLLEEGTGIVHTAVMYGEDDFKLGKKFNLPFEHTVDQNGYFKGFVKEFAGQFVKEADPKITENLKKRGLLYKEEKVLHSYPFCWRCDTPLLYYAVASWYLKVTKIRKELVKNNKQIRWVPWHIKEGRFGNWLKEARDWNVSRNRFWGAPIPIWHCSKCQAYKCIGSVKGLGQKPKDLHRPYIDKVFLKCEKCKGIMKRVPEVFDCWFESGSMPYGQWHYPFENKKLVEKTFPADFIAEGLDQTRGWFYTLHVLATALFDKPAFKNVIVNGLILDEQGRKLSKRLRNYPEAKEVFDKCGADSLRYFLLSSTPIGEDYRFSSKGVQEAQRKVLATILNSYLFFSTYRDKNFKSKKIVKPVNILNKWIIARLHNLNEQIVLMMDKYEITKGARPIVLFVDDFSNWYIRRARRYFQKPKNQKEKQEFSQTLYYVLFNLSKITAPFLPFISEEIYQNLKTKKDLASVHFCDYPKPDKKSINKKLEEKMVKIREIAVQVLAKRAKVGIKVRQPLAQLQITNRRLQKDKDLLELIKEEVNVKKIVFGRTFKLDTKITPELKEEGLIREVMRNIQDLRKEAGFAPRDKILIVCWGASSLNKILEKHKKTILAETLAKDFQVSQRTQLTFDAQKEAQINQDKLWLGIKKHS